MKREILTSTPGGGHSLQQSLADEASQRWNSSILFRRVPRAGHGGGLGPPPAPPPRRPPHPRHRLTRRRRCEGHPRQFQRKLSVHDRRPSKLGAKLPRVFTAPREELYQRPERFDAQDVPAHKHERVEGGECKQKGAVWKEWGGVMSVSGKGGVDTRATPHPPPRSFHARCTIVDRSPTAATPAGTAHNNPRRAAYAPTEATTFTVVSRAVYGDAVTPCTYATAATRAHSRMASRLMLRSSTGDMAICCTRGEGSGTHEGADQRGEVAARGLDASGGEPGGEAGSCRETGTRGEGLTADMRGSDKSNRWVDGNGQTRQRYSDEQTNAPGTAGGRHLRALSAALRISSAHTMSCRCTSTPKRRRRDPRPEGPTPQVKNYTRTYRSQRNAYSD